MSDFAYADISNNMPLLKFNKVLSIFRSNLQMMSLCLKFNNTIDYICSHKYNVLDNFSVTVMQW